MSSELESSDPKPPFNLESKTLGDLQAELYKWQEYNFGRQSDKRMVLGICEECGELCHAILKMQQGIRGDEASLMEETKDAIGDICIYALNLLSNNKESLSRIVKTKPEEKSDDQERISDMVLTIFCAAGRIEIARMTRATNPPHPHQLRPPEPVRIVQHTQELFMQLNGLCALLGFDLEEVIKNTWKLVGKRDWKAFPKNGRTE